MSPFQRWLLLVSSSLTGLTGLVYGWMRYFLDPVGEWAVINHPLQPWVLKAHILIAPAMVFALGLVMTDHIWKHLRSGTNRGRISGVICFAVLIPMVLTGYLIQIVTHATWLWVLVWTHLTTGLVYLVGTGIHTRVRRRNGARLTNGNRASSTSAQSPSSSVGADLRMPVRTCGPGDNPVRIGKGLGTQA